MARSLPAPSAVLTTVTLFVLTACADRLTAPGGREATRAPDLGAVSPTPLGPPPLAERARPYGGRPDDGEPPMPRRHRPHEPNGAASRDATSTKLLVYHGGRVQTTPRIYLVYWGPSWFSGGDPDGVATRLHLFYKGIGGSTYADLLKAYEGKSTAFTNPIGQYKGWRQDTSAVPTHPSQSQIETVTFTSMPYMPYLDALGRGCGGGTVNGAKGKLDGVTILAAHEYGETVNDPDFQAWYDIDGDEVADKCSWINLRNYTLRNGYSFPVQPQWSNALRKAKGNGCLWS